MASNRLTDRTCRHALPGSKISDGKGLYLLTTPEGSRFWRFRFTWDGKESTAGLGPYPEVGLAEARRRRDEYRELLRRDVHPVRAKRDARAGRSDAASAAPVLTLAVFAQQHHERIRKRWRNEKHQRQWFDSLKPVLDALGNHPLDAITEEALLETLGPILRATPETGKRIAQRLRSVFDDARLHRLVRFNPVREIAASGALKRPGREQASHFAALPYREVPGFIARLRSEPNVTAHVRLAIEFLVLTATRSGDVRHAAWREIDQACGQWIIPGSRTRSGRDHVVPLSPAAIGVLREARGRLRSDDLIFPSPARPAALTDMALLGALKRILGKGAPTIHGFRSCFADWSRNEASPRDHAAVELCLARRDPDLTRAYARDLLLEERRDLLERWAAFVTQAAAPHAAVVRAGERCGNA